MEGSQLSSLSFSFLIGKEKYPDKVESNRLLSLMFFLWSIYEFLGLIIMCNKINWFVIFLKKEQIPLPTFAKGPLTLKAFCVFYKLQELIWRIMQNKVVNTWNMSKNIKI